MVQSTQLRVILIPLHHEPFGCFEDPPVPLSRFLWCNDLHRGLCSKHQRGMFRLPLGVSISLDAFKEASVPGLWLPASFPALSTGDERNHYRTG